MSNLSKFVSKHYNVSESDLPKVVTEVQARLDTGDYDDPRGGISEYMVYDLVDEVMCDLDIDG